MEILTCALTLGCAFQLLGVASDQAGGIAPVQPCLVWRDGCSAGLQVTPVRVSVKERKARLAERGVERDAELQVHNVSIF